MKKKVRKLTLSRETLRSLDGLSSALGGAGSFICSRTYNCSVCGCTITCLDETDCCTDVCTGPCD